MGLSLLLSYTYSKSFDDISSVFGGSVGSGLPQNSQDLPADRGPSDFNAVTHRLLRQLLCMTCLSKALGSHGPGWSQRASEQLAGGRNSLLPRRDRRLPWSSPAGFVRLAAAFGNPARPDIVGDPTKGGSVAANPNCQAPAQVGTVQDWYNPCAFAQPAQENFGPAFGTEGRNTLIGPAYTNLDFSLSKALRFARKSRHLLLRGEFFNLLNHPNFDTPDHVFDVGPCPSNSSLTCPLANFGAILSANAYGDNRRGRFS